MILAMAGIGLVATAWLPLVALGAILIGAGNGPATPASTYILSRRTPPRLLSMVLSVKQTGASIGTVLAGVAVPLLVITWGWHGAALACSAVALAVALVLERLRGDMDRDVADGRASGQRQRPGGMAGLRLINADRRLVALASCGLTFCMLQIAVTTYFVTFLVEEIAVEQTMAGYLFALSVASAVVARVILGAVADRLGDCKIVLAVLGGAMGVAAIGFALLPRGAPTWQIALLGIVFASSAMTWSGVFLAEAVPHALEGQIGTLVGALMIFTYIGSIAGPFLFGLIVTTLGSFPLAFVVTGVPSLLSGAVIFAARSPANAGQRRSGG
ncbi:MAG: MFS transporter [Betaproteobacteria bacterium]|nr:MFS transporter [Betaproteobacteria bacterium]